MEGKKELVAFNKMDQVLPNIPNNLDLGKISSEMGGGAMIDETKMNDQVHQQIVGFLKTERLKQFCSLATSEERIKFIYKHEAYWPLLQVTMHNAHLTGIPSTYFFHKYKIY